MMILVNVFAIVSAVMFYAKKIRPEPFLLGSVIWLFMMVAVWYILPYSIFRKAATFKESFTIFFEEAGVRLQNNRGEVDWQWNQFYKFMETPHFFHLYFDSKSFFLVPKDNMSTEMLHDLRGMFNKKIVK